MQWNWQQKDWPRFRYENVKLAPLEAKFLQQAGMFVSIFMMLKRINLLLIF